MTITEIENVIGSKLIASAYKYNTYCYLRINRPLASVIYNASYDIEKLELEK